MWIWAKRLSGLISCLFLPDYVGNTKQLYSKWHWAESVLQKSQPCNSLRPNTWCVSYCHFVPIIWSSADLQDCSKSLLSTNQYHTLTSLLLQPNTKYKTTASVQIILHIDWQQGETASLALSKANPPGSQQIAPTQTPLPIATFTFSFFLFNIYQQHKATTCE